MTKSQVLKEKLKKKIAYSDLLEEEIKELAKEYNKIHDKELRKKYPGAVDRKVKPIRKVPF